MRPALHSKFVEKAEAALVSAVEVYNKPGFQYREETFALLSINAWELLLKACILKEQRNDPKSIRLYESRRTKAGKLSKKRYLKRNRAGAPLTLSLGACIAALDKADHTRLSPEVRANLDALVAIRDSAAHYINASPVLSKQVLEIASATVKNFVLLTTARFDRDLSDSLSLVLPLSFMTGHREVDSVVVTAGEHRLLKYLQGLANTESTSDSPFSVAVRIEVRFERSKLPTAAKVQVTRDPDAVKVVLTEQDVRQRYPWSYKKLREAMKSRYKDFKCDRRFHELRMPLRTDPRYVHERLLDPGNPRSGKKEFYSPAILAVFDKAYARKSA